MTDSVKRLIEDNIDLIDNNNFDDLFNLCKKVQDRIHLASVLLKCGIDYHVNIKKSSRQNVNRFIADLRLSKGTHFGSIKKGPYETGQYTILSSQYMITLRTLLLDRIPDNIKSEYSIDRTETALVGAWSPYPQYSEDKTIIIINS